MSPAKKKVKVKKDIKKTATAETRRRVSAILDVMAGNLTPTQAAEALSISVPKYYILESKALDGMLEACKPRKPGFVRTAEQELKDLQKEYAKLERECARYRTLVRTAQRAAGFNADKGKKSAAAKSKRNRKPTVRALTMAERIKVKEEAAPAAGAGEKNRKAM